MRKLFVVRHGETDYNIQNRYAGKIDVPLNEKGIMQATELSERIANLPVDIIISSTKKRALQTANIINRKMNKPMVTSELLIERDLGIFEGITRDDVKLKYPDMWKNKTLHKLGANEHKGETVEDVINRAYSIVCEVKEKYTDKNVLFVTHGYVSRMINKVIKNLSHEEANSFLLDNCELAEYYLD